MKVDKIIANNQPNNWLDTIINECRTYPIQQIQINKDDLVLDIGANVGGFWKAWSHISNNWHMVEPSVYNCEQIRVNGYEGICSHNAVSSKSGDVVKLMKFWGDGDNDTVSGNFGTTEFVNKINNHGWRGDYEECITISLEDLIGEKEVGLLKIDCEGAEFDFLYEKDLSKIKYIVGEFHNFLFQYDDRGLQLLDWINKTHTELYSIGDGDDSHYVKLWKLK